MSEVRTSLALQDRLTGPLTRMMRAMDRTIGVMERMDRAANSVDARGLARARSEIQSATADLERLRSSTSAASASAEPLNRSLSQMEGHAHGASMSIKGMFVSMVAGMAVMASINAGINSVKSFVTSADAYTSTSARLKMINDQTQTQVQLQEKIYQAAQRSRTGYNDMANSVAKLNLLAKDAFKGNDEAIRFSELMGKAFTVSGASTQEREAGMYQLTQSMAAGKLQGDEFRSIMENAPLLADAIAKSMGKSKGELKTLSSKGVITADIIKNALFQASDDIEAKFKTMPLTFGQAMTQLSNWSSKAFQPLFIRFNEFVNSDAFATLAGQVMWFINIFTIGMGFMFDTLEWLYGIIGNVGKFFDANWSWIAPILTVICVVLGTMGAILLGLAIKWAIVKTATAIATAAQWAYNTAMYAFPGTWILLAFVAVIALVIYALINWADQTSVVVGVIVGLFATMGAFIWNQIAQLWNFIATFGEFLINIFIDPTYAVQKLFYDMAKSSINLMASIGGSFDNAANILGSAFVSGANIAITAINWVIRALKKIPGIDISEMSKVSASAGSNMSHRLTNFANNLQAPTSSKGVVSIPRMDLKSLPDAFNAGNAYGQKMSQSASAGLTKMYDKVSGTLSGKNGTNPLKTQPPGTSNPLSGAVNPTGGKLDKIGKIEDKINIADEDLKMLLELADIKSIQNFKTLQPSFTFGDLHIREEADIDKIVNKINESLTNSMNESVEGAYS